MSDSSTRMSDVSISVIVPAYNAADTLAECLRALGDQSLGRETYEVIVVDDGSTDSTREIAGQWADQTLSQPKEGPAAARNAGARAARGQLLVFTDADCAPAVDFLAQISAPFEDPEVAGAKGAYRTRQRDWVPRFVQAEYAHKYARMRRRARIDFIDTYAAAYRREIFLANGGFDTHFPTASVEDQEFSFRLARKGYRLVFNPGAIVYHRHDATVAEYARRKFGIGYWKANMLRWHPERLMADSHTPLAQRLQVALLPPVLALAISWGLWGWGGWPLLAGLVAFVLSWPAELYSLMREDLGLAVIFPFMVVVRTAALTVGLVAGAVASPQIDPGQQWRPLSPWQRLVKRGFDLVVGLLGLLVSAPALLAAALAIKLEDGGDVFFKQERVGEGGRRFMMVKLRTMVPDAEARLGEVLGASALEGPAFKIPDDPRVTQVGRFLRRWSLDELPQLWNIVKGEMSLVGPRPEEVRVVEQYDDRQRRRLAVPPGLTGPMQVAGRGLLDLEERLELELEYIEGYSLGRDIDILLRTIPAVLSGEGAI